MMVEADIYLRVFPKSELDLSKVIYSLFELLACCLTDIWARLVISAGILQIPVFSVPVAFSSQESRFLFCRNLDRNIIRKPVCMGPT
jgi:hypothetical protein